MSLKVKKTSSKKEKELSEVLLREKKTDDKENKYASLRLRRKNVKEAVKSTCEEVKLNELHELPSPTSKPGEKVKTLGFWCKKLQDLENASKKNQECGLYDFDESDESDFCYKTQKMNSEIKSVQLSAGQQYSMQCNMSTDLKREIENQNDRNHHELSFQPHRRKKKLKQKGRVLKKKQPLVPKCNKPTEKKAKMRKPEKQMKEIHRQSLCREKIILSKERKKLAEKGEKFTFTTGMPSLGITSTPAVNNDNLIGASNFLFLSPVTKEDANHCGSVNQSLSLNEKITDDDFRIPSQGTPKVQTRLKRISCKRVLRNGKILNT